VKAAAKFKRVQHRIEITLIALVRMLPVLTFRWIF